MKNKEMKDTEYTTFSSHILLATKPINMWHINNKRMRNIESGT